ncbi:MAG: hypothetical protein AB8B74_06820 [Crocinitomicaceae bacterium]
MEYWQGVLSTDLDRQRAYFTEALEKAKNKQDAQSIANSNEFKELYSRYLEDVNTFNDLLKDKFKNNYSKPDIQKSFDVQQMIDHQWAEE